MAPTQRNSTWDQGRGGADVDAIDLTLSSPEPEARPRIAPRTAMRQQQLPTHFKPKSTQRSSSTARMQNGKVVTHLTNNSMQPTRRINPQHLKQIINSADARALQAGVREVCEISPALAGAVARGLVPHSSFAFDLMHRRSTHTSAARPIKDEKYENEDANMRMKQRLVPNVTSQDSRSPSYFSNPRSVHVPTPQSEPQRKRERQIEASDSSWDSDLDLIVPGTYLLNTGRGSSSQPPLRDALTSGTANRSPMPTSLPRRLFNAGPKVKMEPKVCLQCHEIIDDGICFHHPGPELDNDGVPTCGACLDPLSDTGCTFGMHVSEIDVDVAHKRNQLSGSQSPSKRPRIG
jgi:hypothetical protein